MEKVARQSPSRNCGVPLSCRSMRSRSWATHGTASLRGSHRSVTKRKRSEGGCVPVFEVPNEYGDTVGLQRTRELTRRLVVVGAPVEGLFPPSAASSWGDMRGVRTCATTTKSAHPSSTPVLSNVPSATVTRGSVIVFENCSRMPSLGSTARSSLIADDQSGCVSSARVKMPVPEPSSIMSACSAGMAERMCAIASGR